MLAQAKAQPQPDGNRGDPDHSGRDHRRGSVVLRRQRADDGFSRQHPPQGRIAVHNVVLHRAGDMQDQRADQQFARDDVQRAKGVLYSCVLGDKRQRLPQRPPDRRKARGGSVVDPAGQRDDHQRPIEHPMHRFRQPAFKTVIRVQQPGFGLGKGPDDAGKGDKEDRHAQCFVQREQPRFAGQLRLRIVGQIAGIKAKGDQREDQQGGEPVKELGHPAVAD